MKTAIFDTMRMLLLMEKEPAIRKAFKAEGFGDDIATMKFFVTSNNFSYKAKNALKRVFKANILTDEKMTAKYQAIEMKKVAKLVTITLTTRVVVMENATTDEVVWAAEAGLMNKLRNELHENLENVVDDTEMPYNEETDN